MQWIREAEEIQKEIELSEQYDPEGLKEINERIMDNPYAIFYSMHGLTVNGRYHDESYWLTGLSIKYPELVQYTKCLDINTATIKDVNKLVKTIIKF